MRLILRLAFRFPYTGTDLVYLPVGAGLPVGRFEDDILRGVWLEWLVEGVYENTY